MTETDTLAETSASSEEVQKGWNELTLKVAQLEGETTGLEQELKAIRLLLERTIEHRQKSHAELVMLITGLVSKLPINDIGLTVAKLVEHNNHVNEVLTALIKGTGEGVMPLPAILKALEQTKRDLNAAVKKAVDELIQLDSPLEAEMLQSLVKDTEQFFSPRVIRANRAFVKGQVPRERVVREFGEEALAYFNDMTTDQRFNSRPKPEEIVLAFKGDFESLLEQNPAALSGKRDALKVLYQKVQASKAQTEQARAQRQAFLRLSFALDLIHYYEHQNTEAPDVIFAQRLPALVEQLVLGGTSDQLDEKQIVPAETLLNFIINHDHRLMVINNMGKAGGTPRTLRFVLKLRCGKVPELDHVITEFVRHLIPAPPQPPPTLASLLPIVKLIPADMQRLVVHGLMNTDRLKRDQADKLGRDVGKELGIAGLDEAPVKLPEINVTEIERQSAWEDIKALVIKRADGAAIAAAIRARLHARYDADEMKQSWIVLTEADPISFIRVFCQLPYLPDGKTDPIARTVLESYVTRLMHEKYAATYNKVTNSLRNMYKANPAAPSLVNFMALTKWIDPEAANKLAIDVGMPPQ